MPNTALLMHARRACRAMRALPLILVLTAFGAMPSLASAATPQDVCDPHQPDWAMETFGLALPTPGPIDVGTFPKAVIEANYADEFRMVSLLARGAFPAVQAYWDGIEADNELAARMRKSMDALWAINGRGLYLLNQVEAWRRAMPGSEAAQLVQAYALLDAGGQARGSAYANKVRPERMRLKSSRYELARPILANLMRLGSHYAGLAPIIALHMRFANGESNEAWNEAFQVVSTSPNEPWLYAQLSTFARPEWSRQLSQARLAQLRAVMAGSQLDQAHRQDWESQVLSFDADPDKDPQPGAPRAYWKKRIAVLPSVFNLAQLMEFENRVSNWPEVIAVSDQILKKQRLLPRVWILRGLAHKELGEQQQAYEDLLTASMLGDAWALATLSFSHVRGGYGLKPGDHQAMYELCKLGAAMGNPAGANCMGAAHSEGFAGVRRDDREALRWHLLGARGNVRNSAHDVAVLLPRVVREKPEVVHTAAGFWVRAAVDEGHTFAKNKLAQHPEWQEACGTADLGKGGRLLEWVLWMLSVVF
jgi:hypothetical protein